MSQIVRLSDYRSRRKRVYFNRTELSRLLQLYSERVAQGEWRDYAIDHHQGVAVFSIFRRSQERPLYAIAKSETARGADWAVFSQDKRLVRSEDLEEALAVLQKKLRVVKE